MSHFELEEAAVADCEQRLFDTGIRVNQEAARAADAIGAADWSGSAGATARDMQYGPFTDTVNKLHAEMNHIAEMLGLGRKATVAQDMDAGLSLQRIQPDGAGMNFSRL